LINIPLRKIMRSLVSAALLICIMVAFCFSSACTIPFFSDSKQNTPVINEGIKAFSPVEESYFMSLDNAFSSLFLHLSGSAEGSARNVSVRYIQGINLDISGKAEHWMFGVSLPSGSSLFLSDKTGWTATPWSSRLPEKEVRVGTFISPEDLFVKNKNSILPDPSTAGSDTRELDLRGGVYSLTITSGGSTRYLTFNATTGEPVVLR
jgi:hypothetical protein